MSQFPKDGSTFVVECIDRTAYRWAKYKPQGAKQMGRPGRWQKQVINGDWHRWENCEEPVGEISPAAEDGPITKAFKAYSAKGTTEILPERHPSHDAAKLLPCPFCWSSASLETGLTANIGGEEIQYVTCVECSAQADLHDWQTRP